MNHLVLFFWKLDSSAAELPGGPTPLDTA